MLTQEKAQQLAREWIDSWNQHDLERILSHYSEEIELTSPLVVKRLNNPSGTVRGKKALRAYFETGLRTYPDLRFEFLSLFVGVDSLVLHYKSVHQREGAEFMAINEEGLVEKVFAHYSGSNLP